MAENLLRTKVKTDTRTIQKIAEATGLHHNTITKLIKPDGPIPADRRLMESIQKLAGFYGLTAKFSVSFEPVNDGE